MLGKHGLSSNFLTLFLPAILLFLTMTICTAQEDLKLTILHTNDVHSRFMETSQYSGTCSADEAANNQCYGGFARLHQKVSEIRSQNPNVLYLSGGDYFQGTVWYTIKKWVVVSRFVNLLNHTAMALGNHEFDDNIEGLVPFLNASTFPIISSNIDDSKEPSFQNKIQKSFVTTYNGVQVGIIGYTTTETTSISSPGNLIFNDELTSINAEAQRLYDSGVKILIALGHAGYDVDMVIAKKAPLIDLVVGGHTHSFLYSGDVPDAEQPLGEYPTIIDQDSGRRVPVVQAYAFSKYLGHLDVTFDAEGEVKEWSGNPILLDYKVEQDPWILEQLLEVNDELTSDLQEEIGKTHVFLNGSSVECRLRECNLGNFIADSMVYGNLKYPDELFWSDVTVAILTGGMIRASIDERAKNGSINTEDLITVLPFGNTIDLIEIKGKYLREAFEFSVVGYDPNGIHIPGKFLQVSGFRVIYDLSKPDYSRVFSLETLCVQCRIPSFVPIDLEQVYKVALNTYMADGGDGYEVIKNNTIMRHETGILDTDLLLQYIQSRSPVIQGIEGRIQFLSSEPCKPCEPSEPCEPCSPSSASGKTTSFFLLGTIFCVLGLSAIY